MYHLLCTKTATPPIQDTSSSFDVLTFHKYTCIYELNIYSPECQRNVAVLHNNLCYEILYNISMRYLVGIDNNNSHHGSQLLSIIHSNVQLLFCLIYNVSGKIFIGKRTDRHTCLYRLEILICLSILFYVYRYNKSRTSSYIYLQYKTLSPLKCYRIF